MNNKQRGGKIRDYNPNTKWDWINMYLGFIILWGLSIMLFYFNQNIYMLIISLFIGVTPLLRAMDIIFSRIVIWGNGIEIYRRQLFYPSNESRYYPWDKIHSFVKKKRNYKFWCFSLVLKKNEGAQQNWFVVKDSDIENIETLLQTLMSNPISTED